MSTHRTDPNVVKEEMTGMGGPGSGKIRKDGTAGRVQTRQSRKGHAWVDPDVVKEEKTGWTRTWVVKE